MAKFLVLPTSSIDAKGGYSASVLTTVVTAAGGVGDQGFYGFNLSNPTTTTLSVSGGSMSIYDSTSASYVKITKVGSTTISIAASGAGGLDTGTAAPATWYYPWVIFNPTTSTTSALISLSFTAPTLPTGYTLARRVGSIYLNGGTLISNFVQTGAGPDKTFYWGTPVILTQTGSLGVTMVSTGASASTLATTLVTSSTVENIGAATRLSIYFYLTVGGDVYLQLETPQANQTQLGQAVVPCINGEVGFRSSTDCAPQVNVTAWTESL